MNDYIKKAFYTYNSIEDIELAFTPDVRNCETFGDLITSFNFWFGFISGWCKNNTFVDYDRQYKCYMHLKDVVRVHFLYLFSLENENLQRGFFNE